MVLATIIDAVATTIFNSRIVPGHGHDVHTKQSE